MASDLRGGTHDIFLQLLDEIRSTKQVTPPVVVALDFIVGSRLIHALDIVDRRNCVRLVAEETRRRMYRVTSQQSRLVEEHIVLSAPYCTCPIYFQVAVKKSEICCKHELAVYLAEALGSIEEQEIPEDEFVKMMLDLGKRRPAATS